MATPVSALPSATSGDFECQEVPRDVFLDVLRDATVAVGSVVPYAVIGGVASAVHGRDRWTYDIDLFVRGVDADAALKAIGRVGFETTKRDPHWLYKGIRDGVLVDIIFRGTNGLEFDDEMITRSTVHSFHGVPISVIGPEDLLVFKATAHKEHRARDWFDALGVLGRASIDWDYLVARSRHGARRMASLLLYAQSVDLAVPRKAVLDVLTMADP
jgi:hypothetical protein